MPEFRKDPIVDRWVILAPERGRRPEDFRPPPRDPEPERCPFCPGHEEDTPPELLRAEGDDGDWRVRVVPNKYPALRVEEDAGAPQAGLYQRHGGVGAHEVIIEGPEHELTLAEREAEASAFMLWAARERIRDLSGDIRLRYACLFKNEGRAAGATKQHGHAQLIASPLIPREVQAELDAAARYYDEHGACVWCQLLDRELALGRRIVAEHADFVVLCPYAPRFPFEAWILPRHHHSAFEEADDDLLLAAGAALQDLLRRLYAVVERPAYNLVLHTAPLRAEGMPDFHWHLELIPALTRGGGFEWGAGAFINAVTPEDAAEALREVDAREVKAAS